MSSISCTWIKEIAWPHFKNAWVEVDKSTKYLKNILGFPLLASKSARIYMHLSISPLIAVRTFSRNKLPINNFQFNRFISWNKCLWYCACLAEHLRSCRAKTPIKRTTLKSFSKLFCSDYYSCFKSRFFAPVPVLLSRYVKYCSQANFCWYFAAFQLSNQEDGCISKIIKLVSSLDR